MLTLFWQIVPGSFEYLPEGATIYFDRTDVKEAIHAPLITWEECSSENVFVGYDTSLPSAVTVLPGVIDRTQNVIVGHGALDMILYALSQLTPPSPPLFPSKSHLSLDAHKSKTNIQPRSIANGTLLQIQNMTWGGLQGFQAAPTDPFYVPYHTDVSDSTLAGAGVFGSTVSERGLTYVGIDLSGHMVPQYAPSAAFRHVEALLGRVSGLNSTEPFTAGPGAGEAQVSEEALAAETGNFP